MSITPTVIIAEARSWIGTPYRHQASLKGVGCDCLGLVRGVWRTLYGEEPERMPAYSRDWAEASLRETLAEAGTRHLMPVAHDALQPPRLAATRRRAATQRKRLGHKRRARDW